MKRAYLLWLGMMIILLSCRTRMHPALVIQTDFGLKDGAVSAMKGVAVAVDPDLKIYDLTHEIPAYNIWEAAYRLEQTAAFWPAGTVFVSVVDPGVGTSRKSVVLKTRSGHFFVGPDNGTLTLVSESLGIDEVREIDSVLNRRQGYSASYTFHGRDVYAYTAARLASGKISFEQVGRKLPDTVVKIPYQRAETAGTAVKGTIPILDVQYGNVWTNIPDSLIRQSGHGYGDSLSIEIRKSDSVVYIGRLPLAHTFGDVKEGESLAYFNSLMNFSLAINMGDFARSFHISSGADWSIYVR